MLKNRKIIVYCLCTGLLLNLLVNAWGVTPPADGTILGGYKGPAFPVQFAQASVVYASNASDDPIEIITKRINEAVCQLLHIVFYVSGGIAALMIILAGVKHITAEDPEDRQGAKMMILYALGGLVMVILACPVVDYLVVYSKIVPLEDSCDCFIIDASPPTSTPHGSTTSSSTTSSSSSTSIHSSTSTSSTSTSSTSSTTTIITYTNKTICFNAEDSGNCYYLCSLGQYYNDSYCCTEHAYCCGLVC